MQAGQPIKLSLFYVVTLIAVGAAIVGVLQLGSSLPPPVGTSVAPSGDVPAKVDHTLRRLFVQLLVIIVVAQLMGKALRRVGQPAVIGEMTAGILLGPSLFGWLAPDAFAFVFPRDSLGALRLLSQIGVCLFMFVVGMDLNMKH